VDIAREIKNHQNCDLGRKVKEIYIHADDVLVISSTSCRIVGGIPPYMTRPERGGDGSAYISQTYCC
jgi:hypothetical protein